MNLVLVVIAVLLGGMAASVQSQALGVMEERVGTLASAFVTYGAGGLAVTMLMLVFQGSRVAQLRDLPWWTFSSGLMGLVIVAALGVAVARLGLGAGLTLFTGASLTVSALVEHFGVLGLRRALDGPRILGLALVITGTWLVVRG